jgi:ATP sulfurylase
MPVLEIDLEQVEYIQTIGQGWAYPLNNFMNDEQLLEVMQYRTLTDKVSGEKVLMSVPITQSCSKD